jgi:hypothetical protein
MTTNTPAGNLATKLERVRKKGTSRNEKARRAALRENYRKERPKLNQEFWAGDDETLFPRKTTAAGIQYTPEYLEAAAVHGGGPPFFKLEGGRVLYRKRDVVAWLMSRAKLVGSTSEYDEKAATPPDEYQEPSSVGATT